MWKVLEREGLAGRVRALRKQEDVRADQRWGCESWCCVSAGLTGERMAGQDRRPPSSVSVGGPSKETAASLSMAMAKQRVRRGLVRAGSIEGPQGHDLG